MHVEAHLVGVRPLLEEVARLANLELLDLARETALRGDDELGCLGLAYALLYGHPQNDIDLLPPHDSVWFDELDHEARGLVLVDELPRAPLRKPLSRDILE